MNIQPIKVNFNNKIYQITFKGIDSENNIPKKVFKNFFAENLDLKK